jgi:hypothetical protein
LLLELEPPVEQPLHVRVVADGAGPGELTELLIRRVRLRDLAENGGVRSLLDQQPVAITGETLDLGA